MKSNLFGHRDYVCKAEKDIYSLPEIDEEKRI